jgi:hypothetical protein
MNAPEIDAINGGHYELDDDATTGLINLWAESVHGEWLWYGEDNPESDQLADIDGYNDLSAMVNNLENEHMKNAFKYLQRMEVAAHAAVHAVEEGLLEINQ